MEPGDEDIWKSLGLYRAPPAESEKPLQEFPVAEEDPQPLPDLLISENDFRLGEDEVL